VLQEADRGALLFLLVTKYYQEIQINRLRWVRHVACTEKFLYIFGSDMLQQNVVAFILAGDTLLARLLSVANEE
jgi:hypothetical protein